MIRQNQKAFNFLQVLLDAACIVFSFFAAWEIVRFTLRTDALSFLKGQPPYLYFLSAALFAGVHLFFYKVCGIYKSHRTERFLQEFIDIVKANLFSYATVMIAALVTGELLHAQVCLTVFFFLDTLLLTSYRFALRNTLRFLRAKGYNKKYLLLLGVNGCTPTFIEKVRSNPNLGYHFLGYMEQTPHTELDVPYLGTLDKLEAYISTTVIDEAVIMFNDNDAASVSALIHLCEKWGVKFSLVPNLFSAFSSRLYINDFDGMPMLNLRKVPLDSRLNLFLKRGFDIAASLCLMIMFFPAMLLTAVAVKLSSPGPVIFRQDRVGFNRRTFTMYKFRSMRVETEQLVKMAQADDERCTRVGRFLRRYSIDELPQLFNVFIGNMSLVGPRPEIPHFVEQFQAQIPSYMVKHYLRPGMTGWAQVNGLRGNTSIADRIKYDLYYIENWSFFFDLKILFLTLFRGIFNKNAC